MQHDPVRTCVEAAKARNISLTLELKSLLLTNCKEIICVHIRGDELINSKSIKKILNTRYLRFLTKEELLSHGLQKGIINPWNISFCKKNLISKSVLINKTMYTNNGSLTEDCSFEVKELFQIKNTIIGEFSYVKQNSK